jgi:gluconolactonase
MLAGMSTRSFAFAAFVTLCMAGASSFAPRSAAADSLVAPGAKPERIANAYAFTEGPATDKDGNVFFTDQPNDRIVRWDAGSGQFSDWLKPSGRSNGTYFDRDGNLWTCADDLTDKKVTVVVKHFGGKLLNGPNDLWLGPDGKFVYFTDPLYPRPYWKRDKATQQPGQYVYALNRGTGEVKVAAKEFKQPNGIIGTPDGRTLYVADIGGAKTYAFDIQPDGSLANQKLFCELGSDGMTIDAEGHVYLTGRGVTIFDKTGARLENIAIPEPWTANVTFGGKDRDILFVTASKSVWTVKMRVKGAK